MPRIRKVFSLCSHPFYWTAYVSRAVRIASAISSFQVIYVRRIVMQSTHEYSHFQIPVCADPTGREKDARFPRKG